jgi:glycerophosphoryl diester phosphodiesterase
LLKRRTAITHTATALALVTTGGCALQAAGRAPWPPRPTVIAHRGASAQRPEHTLAAYQLAIEQGADFIEPDLAITRDGMLVCRHENALAMIDAQGQVTEATTDVHVRPEFVARRTTKTIDGKTITGWFTEDFTLAELKTLRARERIAALRPANAAWDDRFDIPTLQEVIDLAKSAGTGSRTVGIYPETKHPTYFRSIGLPLEEPLLAMLTRNGWNHAAAPVFIQSFEVSNLKALRRRTALPLVQLIAPQGQPFDTVHAGRGPSYADLTTPSGLADVARYAQGIGPHKSLVIPVQGVGLGSPTALVREAQARHLLVHIWTMRPENAFLPPSLRRAPLDSRAAPGDAVAEIAAFLQAGIDGFFTDDVRAGRAAVQALQKR